MKQNNITSKKHKLYLVVPNIRSCHNVGAMFRTADACGVDALFLCGYTATPPKPQIDKVSLGAETWMPWEHFDDVGECLNTLKKEGVEIVALEQTSTSMSYTSYMPQSDVALIVGNEVDGLDAEICALADVHIEIPMRGKKKSLNVSIAAGVVLYDLSNKLFV